ncbi:phospholipase D family protein [Ruegeria aquimaris]|uniref:Phospholipase D family protein n=1 Tax=Ruegeria aquimaris TaxID=2984333 RepID=A0ABT3APS6_9RHOB|nr:phospholipase D family protein [Ruegeria sp. XHP0148]MCV2890664.1 phospholipase D family protein [Ruegeria sp. XHP0148]
MQGKAALDPENRALYGEILRPPAGCEVDAAVATTYTLDFETALVVPATLAFHAAETRAQTLDTPLALLEGLERLASRIAIFCEAGRIRAMPKEGNRLTALLEETVTEVLAPEGGAFHPKLWLLRFRPVTGEGPARLRLALLSRNLTTDTSWDMSLCLDGAVGEANINGNAPLVTLLTELPNLASGRPTPTRVKTMVASLATDLARAEWEYPENIRKICFAVNGLGGKVWKPRVGRTLGIVSPFVTDGALSALSARVLPENAILLGRSEEMALLKPETLARFEQCLTLDEMAETEDGEETEDAQGPVPAHGLHAKVFLTENHSSTEITIGSGNATTAALIDGSNVEVFATLSGYTRHLGTVADQLAEDLLGRFLRPFRQDHTPETPGEDAAARRLDLLRRKLAEAAPELRCVETGELVRLHLSTGTPVHLPDGITLSVWPLMAGRMHATSLPLVDCAERALMPLPLRDVTRWIGVLLRDEETGLEQSFTLGTTLKDLPDRRSSEILRSFIENRETFLRYIRLLLGDVSAATQALFAAGKGGKLDGVFGTERDSPILEDMVRALSGDGRQLRDIERLVRRLAGPDSDETDVIPREFLTLWETFRQVLPENAP